MVDEKTGKDVRISKSGVRDMAHDVSDRVTDEACLRVAVMEERRIKEIFRLANIVAERAGRKTVREEDIVVVMEILSSDISGFQGGN
jgi:histone H3/H4